MVRPLLALLLLTTAPLSGQTIPELEPFEPYVGRTWKATFADGTTDVSRWTVELAGQAVKIVHSVGEGAYGGETLVVWDRTREELVYYYFTTAGFYTHGTAGFDAEGRLTTRELVTGNEDGVTEVRAVQEILADGRMRVETRMLRDGEWEERGVVHYVEDPDARLVLPRTAGG